MHCRDDKVNDDMYSNFTVDILDVMSKRNLNIVSSALVSLANTYPDPETTNFLYCTVISHFRALVLQYEEYE